MQALHDAPCRIDGRPARFGEARLALDDPTVEHGLGLFETLALRAEGPLDLDAHLARLEEGAGLLGLPWHGDDAWRVDALSVSDELASDSGWLKLLLSGHGTRFVYGGPFPADEIGRAASAVIVPWRLDRRGPLAGLKTTSYAGHALAARWAEARGCDEGIWLNDRGHLAEGCRSNLFVVVGGALRTAAIADGVLPGVVRQLALDVARERGMRVHEGVVRIERLARAGEAFLTSSVRGVRPLIEVDGTPIGDGRPGPITARLAEAIARRRQPARSARPT